jgi:hypothetical protein
MFDLMGPGLLIAPWTGLWDLAWQSPTTGFALLACLPTLLLTGFFLMTRDSQRYPAEPLAPRADSAYTADRRQDDGSSAERRQTGRGRVAA